MQKLIVLMFALVLTACTAKSENIAFDYEKPKIKVGMEVLLENEQYLSLLKGKRVGLITNPTGVNSKLESTIDLLHAHPDINLVSLFGPEHGIRGEAYAGQKVEDYPDKQTGLPVHSLYGSTRRAKPEWLENVDVMVYDIQDVGSRSYTYIYTMAYAMEECAKLDIPFVILDRPNPAGAHIVDGNILDTMQHKTFVGLYPIAYQYGMTPGEIAQLFNNEVGFNSDKVDLTVVPVEGYKRDMFTWDTSFPYVTSSTHIVQQNHPTYYSLTGIIGEIRHVSIGVGYTLPFETIAAPWIDRDELTEALRERDIPGLMIRPITYTPKYGPYGPKGDVKAQTIEGVHLVVSDYDALRPFTAQIHIMEILHKLYPDDTPFTDEHAQRWLFDEVLGTDDIRDRVLAGQTADEIIASYQDDYNAFLTMRAKYLIYK